MTYKITPCARKLSSNKGSMQGAISTDLTMNDDATMDGISILLGCTGHSLSANDKNSGLLNHGSNF